MDAEQLKVIRDLGSFYEEYDTRFPEWYRKMRVRARKIYEEFERRGDPVGKYGKDFDLTRFNPYLAPQHKPLDRYENLDTIGKSQVEKVGQRPDEQKRTGSHLQQDTSPIYLNYTPLADEAVFSNHPSGLVVKNMEDAIIEYPWLQKFISHIVPLNLDKYTAWNAAYSLGGVFVWVKTGVQVTWPIQACFYLEKIGLGQLVRIFVLAEPYSRIHLITGCVMHPKCENALHGCISEVYVKNGAEVTFSFIHSFKPSFHIRPKIGVIAEEAATYRENYILTTPVKSTQLYPTVILKGESSRASMRSLLFGRGSSDIDVGASIIFSGENTRDEIMSRSVVTDEATVKLRGSLKVFRPNARGHLECRALLLSEKAQASAYPNLRSTSSESELTHEAAVGKIAEEQLYYLMSRGLTKDEATSMIARGFLDTDIPGLPPLLQSEINRLVSSTASEIM